MISQEGSLFLYLEMGRSCVQHLHRYIQSSSPPIGHSQVTGERAKRHGPLAGAIDLINHVCQESGMVRWMGRDLPQVALRVKAKIFRNNKQKFAFCGRRPRWPAVDGQTADS